MEKDLCVKCGSEDIKVKPKEFAFKVNNPGEIKVIQKCNICQECDEAYFDQKQMDELAEKIDKEKAKDEPKK